jgi:hypothetical protein
MGIGIIVRDQVSAARSQTIDVVQERRTRGGGSISCFECSRVHSRIGDTQYYFGGWFTIGSNYN